jgi:hypothetical protein
MTSMRQKPILESRPFNNADSFAQAFDEAWHDHGRTNPAHGLDRAGRLVTVLEQLREHPFHRQNPELARQVAEFRVRLLGL